MNSFINKLYNYYSQSEVLLTNNFDLLNTSQLEKLDKIKLNKSLLDNIRQCLLKKQYSNAKLIVNKLDGIEHSHIITINKVIEDIEQKNLSYDINLGINNSLFSISEYHLTNEDINYLKEKLNGIEVGINKNENTLSKVHEITCSNELFKEMIDSINQLNIQLECIKSYASDLSSLKENIQNLTPEVDKIKSSFDNHLQTVNTDFLKVITAYRDQTIQSVDLIKKSAIDTADMVMHDLPKQVTSITDLAISKVEKSISKTLWSNYILFSLGFFICVLVCAWFMGQQVGKTMQKELYKAVYNDYVSSKNASIHHIK